MFKILQDEVFKKCQAIDWSAETHPDMNCKYKQTEFSTEAGII